MRKSVQHLVMFLLPDGASVGIVTYSSKYRLEHSVTVLTDAGVRLRVADSVPDRVHALGGEICEVCGVRAAVRELEKSGDRGGNLILIKGSDSIPGEATEELENLQVDNGLRISSILIEKKSVNLSQFSLDSNILVGEMANELEFLRYLVCAMIQSMKDNQQYLLQLPEVIETGDNTDNGVLSKIPHYG